MKKYLYNSIIVLQLIIVGCIIKPVYSQSESGYLPSDPEYIESLPIMELTPESAALDLPNEVDNSTTIFFPRHDNSEILYLYVQDGTSSCQSVSSIFNTFTYEVNRLRNVSSNTQQTRYAPNYSWNHLNEGICGYGGGTSLAAVHGFLRQAGAMSDWDFDGPDQLNKDDCLRWPTGYEKYFNTMHNKLESVTAFEFAPDGTGIEELKHYLYDHNTGVTPPSGGVVTFGARDYNGGVNVGTLIYPSTHETDQVRIKMEYGSSHGHSVAIIGYSDDVMFDWGGSGTSGNPLPDGEYRNDKDNDMDGDIDMADWEIGAVKIVNSYGTTWGSDGFEWVLYCCLPNIVSPSYTGPTNEFYALTPKETNDPGVVLKVKIEHEKREDIRLAVGYAFTADATTYVASNDHWGYKYDGGNNTFQGMDIGGNVIEGPIEILLDFDHFFPNIDYGKVFLINENTGVIPGEVVYFALVDYRWNEEFELPYSQSNFTIGNPLAAGINYDLIPHKANITSDLTLDSDMVSRFTPTITNSATLTIEDGVNIDMYNSQLIIEAGATLIIGDNVTIIGKRGASDLIIDGNIQLGENVHFVSETDALLNLRLNNNSSNVTFQDSRFDKCDLYNYGEGLVFNSTDFNNSFLYSYRGNITIIGSSFNNSWPKFSSQLAGLAYKVSISSSEFSGNGSHVGIDIWDYSEFDITDNTIYNMNNGIQISGCGEGEGDQNISDNSIYGNLLSGIVVYNSSASIYNNHINNNMFGVKFHNNSNIKLFGNKFAISLDQTQTITDNSSYEVYASHYSFPFYFRYNGIIDENNSGAPYDPLVCHNQEGGFYLNDVRYNCWGDNFSASEDLHPNGYIWEPIWCPTLGIGGIDEDEALFNSAQSQMEDGEYANAKNSFQLLIEQYPESKYADASMKELFGLEKLVGNEQ